MFQHFFQSRKVVNADTFNQDFLAHPLHQWILADKYLFRGITEFLEALTHEDRLSLMKRKRKLILTPASGRYSCALNGTDEYEFILVFPDLVEILKSAFPERGIAILLHEAGHLVRRHSDRSLNIIEAQLEADAFCAHRGYGEALASFLMDLDQTDEIDLRIRYLETQLVL